MPLVGVAIEQANQRLALNSQDVSSTGGSTALGQHKPGAAALALDTQTFANIRQPLNFLRRYGEPGTQGGVSMINQLADPQQFRPQGFILHL